MARVQLKEVTKLFDGDVVAVDRASIDIRDKEFVVLVGPSGCGKSTTLRMVAGLEEVTSGEIYIGDRLVNFVPPKDRDIAMVFQNYALYPHMTVKDNLAFGLKLRKYPKEEIETRVNDAARILGLEEYLERKPKALSGGQRQRVAVGRAIVRKPKVFLFDEPLSNLDAKLRVQMRTEINKLHNSLEATMIYVTHDQVEAMTMGDRIVVMKDGLIHQTDTPLNLYHRPANRFVAGFIGSPPMNLFDGHIEEGGDGFVFNLGGLGFPLTPDLSNKLTEWKGRKLTMGVRSEDLLVAPNGEDRAFQAVVEVVEPMGNEIFVYLDLAGSSAVARVDSSASVEIGCSLPFMLRENRLHFFHPDTEKTLQTT